MEEDLKPSELPGVVWHKANPIMAKRLIGFKKESPIGEVVLSPATQPSPPHAVPQHRTLLGFLLGGEPDSPPPDLEIFSQRISS